MSNFKVTIERIENITKHPNADALQLATVQGLQLVVPKSAKYKVGEEILFFPVQSIMPENILERLGLVGKLSGSQKNRITPVKLRDEISEGLVCRLREIDLKLNDDPSFNYAEQLGIKKYSPELPIVSHSVYVQDDAVIKFGDIESFTYLQRKKKHHTGEYHPEYGYPLVKKGWLKDGEPIRVTEKIHGTFCMINIDVHTRTIRCSTKSMSNKRVCFDFDLSDNLYTRAGEKVAEKVTDAFISGKISVAKRT